MLNIRKY